MRFIGKVLWWDVRDEQGIIKDHDGRRFYFDISTIDNRSAQKIKPGLIVRFEWNPRITNTLCACKVAAANLKERSQLVRETETRKQLSTP